ncbi:MAG: nucleotidyltransferase family protein [Tenacibaculum sp.]
MSYKEILFFVAKCLTVSYDADNRTFIERKLVSNSINWDKVVQLSTAHYVLPALYCNLKRVNFTKYFPKDLIAYMKQLSQLNKQRNEQIVLQATRLNKLLLNRNIIPVFLKGTGNILEGLYSDISERMVGDIDILVNPAEANKTFCILKEYGYYTEQSKKLFNIHRHLTRLVHDKYIAAVEIHKQLLRREKSIFFNYQSVKHNLLLKNGFSFLSDKDKIKHTIFAKMINDYAYYFKTINLRTAYDFYLQANKIDYKVKFKSKKLYKELNAGINLYSHLLSKPNSMVLHQSIHADKHTQKCLSSLNNSMQNRIKKKLKKLFIQNKNRLIILLKAFVNRSYFLFVLNKFTDKQWLRSKLP